MDFRETYYPETNFGGFTRVDGTIEFYLRVNALLQSDFTVLDYGCGRGEYQSDPVTFRRNLRIIRNKVDTVIGIDLDPGASSNPYLDQFYLIEKNSKLPIKDTCIDLCLCDWVLEHIKHPSMFFSEVSRVLKEGGYLCIRTPNKWAYHSLLSRIIPERFHSNILVRVQNSRKTEDIFPAYYKCNTTRSLRQHLESNHFDYCVYTHEPEPSYLSFAKLAYLLGVWYQKIVPSCLASSIFVFARKI